MDGDLNCGMEVSFSPCGSTETPSTSPAHQAVSWPLGLVPAVPLYDFQEAIGKGKKENGLISLLHPFSLPSQWTGEGVVLSYFGTNPAKCRPGASLC